MKVKEKNEAGEWTYILASAESLHRIIFLTILMKIVVTLSAHTKGCLYYPIGEFVILNLQSVPTEFLRTISHSLTSDWNIFQSILN